MGERIGDLAGGGRDAGIVEKDDLAIGSETVGHRRVPVIHGTHVMHVEDERHAAGLTETAIGEADALGFGELCWRGLMGVSGHG
jgi:hypothetical protein